MSPRVQAVLAAVAYFAVALFALRAVVPALGSTFGYAEQTPPDWRRIMEADQKLTATIVAENAEHWLRAPWRLRDTRQCYPFPDATALGEHMFGAGLLGVVPQALVGNPILTYNVAVLASWWIAAMAMYALVAYWTASGGAAFVAGLIFAFHPTRILDLVHLYVPATQWTPLALLFAHRLFTRRRWGDALGLAFFLVLQLLESVYTVLALTILGGTVGAWLVVRHGPDLRSLVPKLLAPVLAAAGAAAAIFGPYLALRATWGSLGGRTPTLHALADFGPGGVAFPGRLALFLVLVALVDRMRGPRPHAGGDPRLVYLVGGLLVLWAAVVALPVPFTDWQIPSLFALAGWVLPGLDAIRGVAAIRGGVYVATAILAGFGVRVLLERFPRRAWAVVVLLTGLVLLEVFWTPAAVRSFGAPTALRAYPPAPLPMQRALFEKLAPGPVLDFPNAYGYGEFFHNATFVWAGAFHGHRVAACYNSFVLPVHEQIADLAARLPKDPRAADALGALGFTNVLWHGLLIGSRTQVPPVPRPLPPPLVERGRAGIDTLLGIEPRLPSDTRRAMLAVPSSDGLPLAPTVVAPAADRGVSELPVTYRNGDAAVFRHPDPIEPTTLRLLWYASDGAIVHEEHVRALLPVALAPGDTMSQKIPVTVPPPGDYTVTLAPADEPTLVLVRMPVRVGAGA